MRTIASIIAHARCGSREWARGGILAAFFGDFLSLELYRCS
jgi:hypothetical protein